MLAFFSTVNSFFLNVDCSSLPVSRSKLSPLGGVLRIPTTLSILTGVR